MFAMLLLADPFSELLNLGQADLTLEHVWIYQGEEGVSGGGDSGALSIVLFERSVLPAAETVVFPPRLATPLAILVPMATMLWDTLASCSAMLGWGVFVIEVM